MACRVRIGFDNERDTSPALDHRDWPTRRRAVAPPHRARPRAAAQSDRDVTTALVLAASSSSGSDSRCGVSNGSSPSSSACCRRSASYALGIDGLSLLLVLLTTFLTFVAVLASWATVTIRAKDYYIAVLVLEGGMLGVYMALDLLLFCLCWVIAAASMCFLIGTVGGRARAALRVCVIAIVPGLVILLGMLTLHVQGRALTGTATFDLRAFQHLRCPWPCSAGCSWRSSWGSAPGCSACSLVGDRSRQGAGGAVPLLLAAVFLKMGTYGFLRLSLPLLPDASRAFAPAVVVLSAIGIVFGAVDRFRANQLDPCPRVREPQPHLPGHARSVLADARRAHRQRRASDQPRDLDRSALSGRRSRCRTRAGGRPF